MMRAALFVLSACATLVSSGQEPSTERHRALADMVKALGAAERDAQKDSLSTGIKQGLRVLLQVDDAFTADLSDIPISRVDAPDGKFRLITWNVAHEDGSQRYEGMLLVRNGTRIALYELRDMTEKIPQPLTKRVTAENWYGALYYALIPPLEKNGGYYTLLGWKGASKVETRKLIDVLSFKGTVPTFGAAIFEEAGTKHVRKVFGFGFQNSMSLKWDEPNKAIVFDHLSPTKPEFANVPAFMGPDLSFDAYVWYKGRWSYLRDVDARNMRMTQPSKRPLPEER